MWRDKKTGSEHEEGHSLSKESTYRPICEGKLLKDGDMTTGIEKDLPCFQLEDGAQGKDAGCW